MCRARSGSVLTSTQQQPIQSSPSASTQISENSAETENRSNATESRDATGDVTARGADADDSVWQRRSTVPVEAVENAPADAAAGKQTSAAFICVLNYVC